jgi:hypothetical protein
MRQGKPTHVAWLWQLSIARAECEIGWCERIADLIDAGVSYLPENFAEVPGWERFVELDGEDVRPGAAGPGGSGAARGDAAGEADPSVEQ